MYFAWLGHYTTALIVPAAVGVIYWVCMRFIYQCNLNKINNKNKNIRGASSM